MVSARIVKWSSLSLFVGVPLLVFVFKVPIGESILISYVATAVLMFAGLGLSDAWDSFQSYLRKKKLIAESRAYEKHISQIMRKNPGYPREWVEIMYPFTDKQRSRSKA